MRNSLLIILIIALCCPLQAQFKCLSGDCINGNGKGTYSLGGQEIGLYEGSFKEGKFEKGKFTYTKGGFYEGEWKDNFVQGYGIRHQTDGTILSGRWEKGRLA